MGIRAKPPRMSASFSRYLPNTPTRFFVAGIDEAGRGPLAGPVTAAAVVLPARYVNLRINDSKKLTHADREELYEEIVTIALAYSVKSLGPRAIERHNILQATRKAMFLAAKEVHAMLNQDANGAHVHFLIDGNTRIATKVPHETIISGDSKIAAISAASILAKVTRDREMVRLDRRYPGYGFAAHKGYGTELHRQKIQELGPSKIHRRTFAGVREHLPVFPALCS